MNSTMRSLVMLMVASLIGCGAATSTPPPASPKQPSEATAQGDVKKVTLLRTPDGGIQPQAVMDKGVLHLIYFKGEPRNGDVFYVKSTDDGKTFSNAIRVNSIPGSVIAGGNVRGAHLAIGAGGRAHVAWMGSMKTAPKGDHHAMPMLYTRLNDEGTAFESQRNVIQSAYGLDGGGSVAADGKNVYVAWHAPTPGTKGEDNRRVWLIASTDEGRSFGKETPISPADSGSCGCCGMRIFGGTAGHAFALFRGANERMHRPMYLLSGDVTNGEFRSFKLHEWETGTCPMSTMAFTVGGGETLAAWETEGQTFFARIKEDGPGTHIAAPGKPGRRRHPTLAANGREVLLAWTEGMTFNKGGGLAWQVYDAKDQPGMNAKLAEYGRVDGVPVSSLIASVATSDQRFLVIY